MTDSNERASYYATLPEYYYLEELRTILLSATETPEKVINFIKKGNIPVNSYVKSVRPNEWVPLLHLCCRSAKYQQVVKFLIKSGVNINLLPDANKDQLEPLLFVCDDIYFKYLIEHGCHVSGGPDVLSSNIKRRLRSADIKRLRLLLRVNELTVKDIINCVEDPVLFCFTSMKEYLAYAFNIRTNLTNLTEELNSVIDKFKICVTQLIDWGAHVSEEAVNFAVKFYLYEFLALPAFNTLKGLHVPYHEHMDRLQVALLRPLLNDARYEKTCKQLNQTPCAELWTSAKDI